MNDDAISEYTPSSPAPAAETAKHPAVVVSGFKGINNRVDPVALGATWALSAPNVLCDPAQFYVLRPGLVKLLEGVKDAFATVATVLAVTVDDRLLSVAPGGACATLATGFVGAPFVWAELGGVAFCQSQASPERQWAVYPERVVPWGIPVGKPPQLRVETGSLPPGIYLAAMVYVASDGRLGGCTAISSLRLTAPGGISITPAPLAGYRCRIYLGLADSPELLEYATTDAPFTLTSLQSVAALSRPLRSLDCYPPPPGDCMGAVGNQLAVSSFDARLQRSTVYFSEPDYPHWFPLLKDTLIFSGRVTLLAWSPATSTLVIGTDTAIYERTQGRLLQVAAYGALAQTAVLLNSGEVAYWTQRGLCSSAPFKELTADRLAPVLRHTSTATRLSYRGGDYYVVAQQGGEQPSPFSAAVALPSLRHCF